jgi:hypothetical protein
VQYCLTIIINRGKKGVNNRRWGHEKLPEANESGPAGVSNAVQVSDTTMPKKVIKLVPKNLSFY